MGYINWSFVFITVAVCTGADQKIKCSQEKYTCNPTDLKEVSMDNGMKMSCDGNTVCNSEYQKPCIPCIESSEGGFLGKKEVLSTDCNDGNGSNFPCRRHPTDSKLYIKCNHFIFRYQKSIQRCTDFVKNEKNNNKCKLLDVCL
ncbi:PREDICTED: uncharacterized protein LOC108567891 [Nicrophorus vespilloides]|uniref:Uncharacterized protein LOC108567891 n=1 Tax=Nicrophorus vespilloides TaxID=110193 RepID=A0ABM1NB98_NICVS|nr:PREDICTED: uncharacterized protein LOC108567891 [Nicrophorus vespilloides]